MNFDNVTNTSDGVRYSLCALALTSEIVVIAVVVYFLFWCYTSSPALFHITDYIALRLNQATLACLKEIIILHNHMTRI